MNKVKFVVSVPGFLSLLSACTPYAVHAAETENANVDLESCLIQSQDMMLGTWNFMNVIETISGGYRTFRTQSIHGKLENGLYTAQSSGGDLSEEDSGSIEYERVKGNAIVPVEDNVDQMDRARMFVTCDGPDDVGRIKTTSTYQIPLDEEGTELLTVKNYSSFSEGGTFFFEEFQDENGNTIARASGVTTPVEG